METLGNHTCAPPSCNGPVRELASSEKLRENLQDQYLRERDARGDTLWSVSSAMTYYARHCGWWLALRRTVEQQDTQASVMLNRELSVAKWIESDAWKKLEQSLRA